MTGIVENGALAKWLAGEAQDASVKNGEVSSKGSRGGRARVRKYLAECEDWTGRVHPDGTPCRAKSPESCPFDRRSERADSEVTPDAKGRIGPDEVAAMAEEFSEGCRGKSERDVERARERLFDAIRSLPWSAFGGGVDARETMNRFADFDGRLPEGANVDAVIADGVGLEFDIAGPRVDPADLYEKFYDEYERGDRTVGETLARALPKIRRMLEDREAEREEEERWGDGGGSDALRDYLAENAPLTARSLYG